MKLVSFDVGLRNLAFCVLTGTNRKDVGIQHWNLIDVMAEDKGVAGKPTCFKCKKSACWQQPQEGIWACGRHKGGTKGATTKAALNKLSPAELWSDFLVYWPTEPKQPTKAVMVKRLYDHARANTWKRAVANYKAGSVADLAPAIVKCLDARADLWRGADLVCFENQPDRRMFAVQCMLHMYFAARGFNVQGVSAIHKLDNILTIDDRTDTYKGRKKTGILHCDFLCPTEEWRKYMLKHPKKDDLADSFLQGLWVMEHTK